MKEYYALVDGEKRGPFELEDLDNEDLSGDTLIWREGIEEWTKAKNIDEVRNQLIGSNPPPEPLSETSRRFLSSHKALLSVLILWTIVHVVLSLLSYNNISDTNEGRSYKVERIWPFSSFTHNYSTTESRTEVVEGNPLSGNAEYETYYYEVDREMYGGILYNYDWSELLLYCSPFWLIIALYYFRWSSKNRIS